MRNGHLMLNTLLATVAVACGSPPDGKGEGEVVRSAGSGPTDSSIAFKVETVAEGLEVPWAIVFTAPDRMLVNERSGRVRQIVDGRLRSDPVLVIENVETGGEIGLMGLTLHPDYAANRFVYLAYGYDSSGSHVKVLRYRDDGDHLVDPREIIGGLPAASNHAGCALGFGPDGHLYITTGDATEGPIAQELSSLGGKILRLKDDGSVPSDNPFVGRSDARPEIWSYGHRNPQGIDWQPGTGTMFESEHGPSGFDAPGGGDEINIIRAGANYGWPVIHHREEKAGMISPLLEYTPALAPASAAFAPADFSPSIAGNLFVGCLRGRTLLRVVLEGDRVVLDERLFQDRYGRIRAVTAGPDGALYISTSNRDGRGTPAANDDRILRLTPQ